MQLGLSTAAFYGQWETEKAAGHMAQLGVSCAEVFLQCESEYTRAFAHVVRENLGPVRCTSVHPLGTGFENGFFSRSLRQRRDTMTQFCRVLDCAAELGARCYVYHGRHGVQLAPLPFSLQANVDAVGPMIEQAGQRGLSLAWENVSWCQLTTPERAVQLARALPDVRFTLDIKQAMRAGVDPIAFIPAMGSRLMNVHICDYDASGKLCLPGEGTFDFGRFFAALDGAGYTGSVILEPYLALIKSEDALLRSLAFLREHLAFFCRNDEKMGTGD